MRGGDANSQLRGGDRRRGATRGRGRGGGGRRESRESVKRTRKEEKAALRDAKRAKRQAPPQPVADEDVEVGDEDIDFFMVRCGRSSQRARTCSVVTARRSVQARPQFASMLAGMTSDEMKLCVAARAARIILRR